MQQSGYEVVAVAADGKYRQPLLPYVDRVRILRHMVAHSINPLREIRVVRELHKLYREEQPTIILHFTIKPDIYGTFAAARQGLPSVATVTGLGYTFLNSNPITYISQQLLRRALGRADEVVFLNPDDREKYIEMSPSLAHNSVIVYGTGVDTRHYAPRAKSSTVGGSFVFLFVGRLLYDKGIREYVAAAKQLYSQGLKIECWILGATADNPASVSEAEVVQWASLDYIRYFGEVADVRPYISDADIVVLPSYREGLPRVILEGMSMYKPIIATDTAGCRETVEAGRNGWLVPVADTPALTVAMRQAYLSDTEQLARMGDYSRKKVVTEFSDEIVTARYLSIIDEVLGTTSNSTSVPHDANE